MKTNAERMQRVMVWLGVVCLGLLPPGPLSAQEPKLRATLTVIPRPDLVWVNAVAYRPDGKALAGACGMNTMAMWDTGTFKAIASFRNDPVSSLGASFWSVAISPDGKMLVSANGHSLHGRLSENDAVQLWDAVSGKKIATLAGHTDFVHSVAISPDGKTVASGSGDRTVRLWEVASRKNTSILKGHADIGNPYSRGIWVTFSPDGKTLASGDNDTTSVKLWSVATGKELATLNGSGPVAFSPDSKMLASGSGDPGYVREFPFEEKLPADKKLSIGPVLLWDVATRKNIAKLEGHTAIVLCVAFSPDGKSLASGSGDNTVRLWDVSTGKNTATLKGHTGVVQSVAFSPDGKTLASGGRDGTIKFWDLPPAKENALDSPKKDAKATTPAGEADVFTTRASPEFALIVDFRPEEVKPVDHPDKFGKPAGARVTVALWKQVEAKVGGFKLQRELYTLELFLRDYRLTNSEGKDVDWKTAKGKVVLMNWSPKEIDPVYSKLLSKDVLILSRKK